MADFTHLRNWCCSDFWFLLFVITLREIAYNVNNNLDEVLLAIDFTVYNRKIFIRSRLALKVVVSEHTVEAHYPRECGGNNKTNRTLKVSILFPYFLLNTVSL